jgi:hypothetical protein
MKAKQKPKRKRKHEKPFTLSNMTFDEALELIVKAKPPKKK